jgi:hypothetical protein
MCKVNSAMIVADGAAVGSALENLAEVIQTTDPTVAADLTAAGQAIIAATTNWQTGDTLTTIEDAEQTAIAVLNVIPETSPFAPLIAIAFTALNLLIANTQTQTTQTGNAPTDAKALLTKADTLNSDSHWAGKAKIKHEIFRAPRKDFEAAWNTAAAPLGVKSVTV